MCGDGCGYERGFCVMKGSERGVLLVWSVCGEKEGVGGYTLHACVHMYMCLVTEWHFCFPCSRYLIIQNVTAFIVLQGCECARSMKAIVLCVGLQMCAWGHRYAVGVHGATDMQEVCMGPQICRRCAWVHTTGVQ